MIPIVTRLGRAAGMGIKGFCILLLISFSFEAQAWQTLNSGIEYQSFFLNSSDSFQKQELHVFRINPALVRFEILHSSSVDSIRKLTENSQALLGFNANFFDEKNKPLGLLISHQQLLNPVKNISWWGVFYLDSTTHAAHVIPASSWSNAITADFAVEAGPRLISDGKLVKVKPQTSPKTVLGITANGMIILVVTLYPVNLSDLATWMARSEKKGGVQCVEALNLDGGSSTQLYAKIGEFELRLPNYAGVPIGVGVFPNQ